jgi:ankyrin repeat protein
LIQNIKYISFFYLALDELLEYYQTDGIRHLRCPLTVSLPGHPLPSFAQRRGTTTVLHQAATEGQRDVIALLLNDPSCPDIHSKNEEGLKRYFIQKQISILLFSKGNTPLHEACFFGRDEAVKELLQAGASWKFVNKLGWTSLHVN